MENKNYSIQRMKNKANNLDNNKMPTQGIAFSLKDALGKDEQDFVLNAVRPRYHYDENRQRTNIVEAIVYTVTDPATFAKFNVRVDSTTPVITPAELAESDELIFIQFPLEETVVKPYKIEYGTASVSIVAPYATIVKEEEVDLG